MSAHVVRIWCVYEGLCADDCAARRCQFFVVWSFIMRSARRNLCGILLVVGVVLGGDHIMNARSKNRDFSKFVEKTLQIKIICNPRATPQFNSIIFALVLNSFIFFVYKLKNIKLIFNKISNANNLFVFFFKFTHKIRN